MVGVSNNPMRPSFEITRYLIRARFNVIPVNPRSAELFGRKCYPDLLSIPEPIDVVDIFRNPDAVSALVEQVIQKKARCVWMQPGTENFEAAERAMSAGLKVILGVCVMHNDVTAQMDAQGAKR